MGGAGELIVSFTRTGKYVRVIGHLRSFMNSRSILAFRIQVIQDENEITYHFLDVIHTHLYNTRGPLVSLIQSFEREDVIGVLILFSHSLIPYCRTLGALVLQVPDLAMTEHLPSLLATTEPELNE